MSRLLHRLRLQACLPALLGVATIAVAAPVDAEHVAPLQSAVADPGIPPQLRREAPTATRAQALAAMRAAPRTRGSALDAQVQATLRASFETADSGHLGTLTRAQASRGGFGYIARHFDAIDVRHAGAVTFDDLMVYVRGQHAAPAAGR